jgi:hypothetical protein
MTEKISSTGPKEPDKNKKKSTPDSDEFIRHIEKAKEAEFEGKRKRKYEKEFEKEKVEGPKTQAPPPSLPSPNEAYQSSQSKGADFDDNEEYDASMDSFQNKAPSKPNQKDDKKKEEITPFKKEEKISSKTLKEEEDKLNALEEKTKIKKEKPTIKQQKEKQNLKEETSAFNVSKEKIHPSSISLVLQEFPKDIAIRANSLTAHLTPYLPSDVSPLFQKMVGTIIHIEQQGITKTQVILNSKAFENSIFYGSTISLTQYSTAPNSYNIILKGPNQAVSMFNENLEGLFNSFKKGNFSFTINRLEAEYERPLFKRKEKTSSSDTDLGSSK